MDEVEEVQQLHAELGDKTPEQFEQFYYLVLFSITQGAFVDREVLDHINRLTLSPSI